MARLTGREDANLARAALARARAEAKARLRDESLRRHLALPPAERLRAALALVVRAPGNTRDRA